MAQNSNIAWTHHTANLWWGCTKVHAGCDHCYAETLSHRWDFDVWGNDKPRRMIDGVWKDLAKFQRIAHNAGEIHRVFVGSMMDIFEKSMPLVDSKGNEVYGCNTSVLRSLLFDDINKNKFPNLLFLFLTKRPSNIQKMIPQSWLTNPPSNVMFGTSPVNQATANTLIPQLLKVKGKKFLSMEPLLGSVDLTQIKHTAAPGYFGDCLQWYHQGKSHVDDGIYYSKIDWVIVGGESGHGARPMEVAWAESIRDQCKATGTPFFFKQGSQNNWPDYGNFESFPESLKIRQFS